jgi:hypothetical protein
MTTYQEVLAIEDHMRKHFNDPQFKNEPMRTDPHHNLVKINPENLDTFSSVEKPPNLLFSKMAALPLGWKRIQHNLNELKPLLKIPNLLVAGGKVFSSLFGTYTRDVDIFLWGITQEDTMAKVKTVLSKIVEQHEKYSAIAIYSMTRTQNSLSLRVKHPYNRGNNQGNKIIKTDYQIILRLYHSPSEILHGFDVDSCCLGYDGKEIWATQRALFSLVHGYNTVNFDRLSPGYEGRLVKYATRGISINVPGYDPCKVTTTKYNNYSTEITGLDLLLQAEAYWRSVDYVPELAFHVLMSIPQISDYDPDGPKPVTIETNINYMFNTADDYPKISRLYLNDLEELDLKTWGSFEIPNPFKTKQIPFLKLEGMSKLSEKDIHHLLEMDHHLYDGLAVVAEWKIPRKINFKTSNPGEQMTNTFHQLVLDDHSVWYNGKYYQQ